MRLRISRGGEAYRTIELGTGELRFGRSGDNDVVLEDPAKGVSRVHAELKYEYDHYVILDLNSQNGTWLNGRRVHRSAVQPGESIDIGGYRLVLDGTPVTGVPPPHPGDTTTMRPVAPRPPAPLSGTAHMFPPRAEEPAPVRADAPVERSEASRPAAIVWLAQTPKPYLIGGIIAVGVLVLALSRLLFGGSP
jgi:hypothetical protein